MSITTMLRATKKQDEWMTPGRAVKALLPFIPAKSKILCPFDTIDSQFVQVLHYDEDKVFDVHFTHIDSEGVYGKDFFSYTPKEVKQFDFIISNPPYSQKDAVFEKLFELGRPFCMLMGATAGLFEGNRFKLFEKSADKLTVIWLMPRVSYIDQSGIAMKSPPFQSAYVCWGLMVDNCYQGNYFARIEKNG